ncbi:MAG: exopolysaccharide biosynthesis protein [Bauldia sp.]|nr:exopolysaccharide biosynthesis protein [Bauldia sp.]
MPTTVKRRAAAKARPVEAEALGLEDLLDRIAGAGSRERVSVADALLVAGNRSFGSLLAIGGLLAATPLGVIPTLPSVIGLMLGLVAAQLLVGMPRVWLPRFLLSRTISRERLAAAVERVRPATRRIDRTLRPRLTFLTRGVPARLIGLACLCLVVAIPPLELVPFMATGPLLAIAAFGLAIFLRDGVVALAAIAIAGSSFVLVVKVLLPIIGGLLV